MQDVFSLAWRLAYVLRGIAGPGLLDTYSQERQPVGRKVVDRAMQSVVDMAPISDALGFAPGQSVAEGWANVDELFSPTDKGAGRRAALDAAVELQHYQFNAHGVEFDLRYDSDAIVDDGTPWPSGERDPELYATPSTHPGAPVAHARIQRGNDAPSTIDIVGRGEYDDVYGDWARIRGIEDSGALLVRPDRVVAWREPGRPADAAEALRGTLDTVLARG